MSKSALNSSIKGIDIGAKDIGQCLGAVLEQSLSSENMVHCIIMSAPPPPPPPKERETYCFWYESRRRLHDSFLRARLMNQPADFNQICMDKTIGHDEELIRFGDLDLISKVNAGLKLPNLSQNLIVCLYLMNQSGDFEYICMNLGHDEELIRFC